MNHQTIIQSFLEFYQTHGCHITPDTGIIPPVDDTSTLYISSGMQPLKEYYLGKKPPYPSMTGKQTCVRLGDIERIGLTDRHLTSFTMLGQFGWNTQNYVDPIYQSWDLLTRIYGLDPQRLHVTYFSGDQHIGPDIQTLNIWQSLVDYDHIHPGVEDNFWRMGSLGPCGPCTEIYYERWSTPCSDCCGPVTCDCDRFLEIYNLVMTQYEQTVDGLIPLTKPCLDTGLGMERLEMILQNKPDVYCVESFDLVQDSICGLDIQGPDQKIILDHIRTIQRMKKSGITPGPKLRPYTLRKLIRKVLIVSDRHQVIDQVSSLLDIPEEYTQYQRLMERSHKLIHKLMPLDETKIRFLHETHGIPPEISRLY